jgi:hypothetical protein
VHGAVQAAQVHDAVQLHDEALDDVLAEPVSPNGDSVNTEDLADYVIEDPDESVGENTPVANAELGNIPEASLAKSGSRWSKHRAGDTDEDSLNRATKLKAQRNEGDIIPETLCFNFDDSLIQSNLDVVGISLGVDKDSVNKSIKTLKEVVVSSTTKELCDDHKTFALDEEEKNLEQEEELDKLILNHLCSDIMEEIMDLGECKNDLLIIPGSTSSKKKTKLVKKIKTCSR